MNAREFMKVQNLYRGLSKEISLEDFVAQFAEDFHQHKLSEITEGEIDNKYFEWVNNATTPITRRMAWVKSAEFILSKLK